MFTGLCSTLLTTCLTVVAPHIYLLPYSFLCNPPPPPLSPAHSLTPPPVTPPPRPHTSPSSSTVLSVRSRCQEMEKENLVMRQELASLRALHSEAISRIRTLETHVHNAESANDSLQRQLKNYTNLRDECEAVVSEGELQCYREK